jgi:hypothetical protein
MRPWSSTLDDGRRARALLAVDWDLDQHVLLSAYRDDEYKRHFVAEAGYRQRLALMAATLPLQAAAAIVGSQHGSATSA